MQRHRGDSKLSHIIDSIRHGLAHEHEKLPGGNEAQQAPAAATHGSVSPALQATASSKLNENNMEVASHQDNKTYGWPGLGNGWGRQESDGGSEDHCDYWEDCPCFLQRVQGIQLVRKEHTTRSEDDSGS